MLPHAPLQIAVAIMGVGFLIGWHELGHYVVARLLGMRVIRYSIGIGPKLWGFTHNDIEYQIAAVPILGFVKVKGMTSLEDDAAADPRSFINRPRWARFLMLAAGPGFNYLMAAVLFFAYFWMWPSPIASTTIEVSKVSDAFPCAVDTDCPASWQCLDLEKMHVCAPSGFDPKDGVAGLAPPAKRAGLLAGDIVATVEDNTLTGVADFKEKIAAKEGAPVKLHVLRGDSALDLDVTPAKTGSSFVIGVAPSPREPRGSLFMTAGAAVVSCYDETVRTLDAFRALIHREPGVQVGSSVAIVAEMKDEIAKGTRFFVLILAMLSVNLGLLNLLPVPALDGIKMLFLAVEGAIRRDLNATFQIWVNGLGLIALLGLMVVLMARDTLHLIG